MGAMGLEVQEGQVIAGEVLARNLGSLFAADFELALRVDSLREDDLPELVPARKGGHTVMGQGGGGIYLHSRFDPNDEGRRLAESVATSEKVFFAVYGLGLGYHVAELLGRSGRDAFVMCFENDLRMVRRAMECVDLSKDLRSRRLVIVTEAEKSAIFAAVGQRTILLSMGTATLIHPPSQRLHAEFHAACAKLVEDHTAFSRTSLNTLVLNSRKTAENIARNAVMYAGTSGISHLAGAYRKQPAIVISAGPSLRKNKHLLPGAKGRAVLISVQTTLKPMLQLGVEPDFVTSLDYHDISGRFFEGLPARLRSELVAEPRATSVVLRGHPGPVSVAGSDFADSLLRELKLNRPRLPAGATVAHLAFYLARYMECDPIIFVGQDLGFSDGLCYAPGTAYDEVWAPECSRFCTVEMKQWQQIVRERPILRQIPDVHGGTMYTEERLFTYLQQFERDFAESGTRGETIIDATEGGALKRGAKVMTLRDALDTHCTQELAWRGKPRESGKASWAEVSRCLLARRDEAERIRAVAQETLPLLEEIRDHTGDDARVNRAIARIDLLRAKMNELGATYDLVTQLTQKTELERFESDMRISAEKELDGHERQRRQVVRDLANCRAIIGAAEEFADLMSRVLDEGESQRRAVA